MKINKKIEIPDRLNDVAPLNILDIFSTIETLFDQPFNN